MGEMMKIGCRGSMNAYFPCKGVQGHSAYPHRAKNPMPAMAQLMANLAAHELDQGTEHFDASTLAVVTIDTGNSADNVIPAETRSTVNIRFNDTHTSDALTAWLQAEVDKVATATSIEITMRIRVSGESFVTPLGELSNLISKAVKAETGVTPKPSTTGGTSDARFVKSHCPVVEFGLVGRTMHEVDERVEVANIHKLKAIYTRILTDYFV
jgi:succinyl-diaminopimelate desuccinylase